eukprot:725811-Prymnesium_polylepis.1
MPSGSAVSVYGTACTLELGPSPSPRTRFSHHAFVGRGTLVERPHRLLGTASPDLATVGKPRSEVGSFTESGGGGLKAVWVLCGPEGGGHKEPFVVTV